MKNLQELSQQDRKYPNETWGQYTWRLWKLTWYLFFRPVTHVRLMLYELKEMKKK